VLSFRAGLILFFSATLTVAPALATRTTHKTPTSSRARHSRKISLKTAKPHKLHGQTAIDSNRATEIQQALIREHYLTGEATGSWDSTTQAAMQKYQSDQGWQTRLMPDSRALKKLGLGPDYSGAINAAGASFAAPSPSSTIPPSQAAGFAAAAGVNQ
jgi:peptidoglycan hydrolase-like protein with peptidoglycan-binding domain